MVDTCLIGVVLILLKASASEMRQEKKENKDELVLSDLVCEWWLGLQRNFTNERSEKRES
ncbi:hypothetical protein T4D_1621 [Trichinella pseudospiralis]|uniref:Uncharacterized protein n=1 Tax=Trichinella pseudospiralis TaxID=6337 RepID=A0A0V1FEC6_TRIPS|nr:hypothetical protein T4D_1621 [Trichinella pseudospiralis]